MFKFERRKKQRREKERRRENMSALQMHVKELRNIVFTMLNFTNFYTLVLDEGMTIRFANNSLAKDLGLYDYNELVGRCWLDFLKKEDSERISIIHKAIAFGEDNWEVYKEVQNTIVGLNEDIFVHWFNSHINSHYNWTFSFGIKRVPEKELIDKNSVREYYKELITQDRVMINSIRDLMGAEQRLDSCEPNFVR